MNKQYIYNLIDEELPTRYREDWLRLINNSKLSKARKDIVLETIFAILKENGIDKETW